MYFEDGVIVKINQVLGRSHFSWGRLRRPQTKMGISSGPKNVVHCIIAKLSPSPSSVGLTSIIFTTSSISCGGGVSSPKNEVG